ncbi:MAG: hypothetical protein ACRDYA_01045 [Egibacteraceae bacterium]
MKDLARWLVIGLAGVMCVGLVVGLPSVAHAETVRASRMLNEAWYLRYREPLAEAPGGDLSCGTPLGCNLAGNATRPAPAVPYPGNTLHIASGMGEPDAQTYLSFDLRRTPRGTVVTGGSVIFVAASADSGTLNEASAQMVACRVTEPFVSVKPGSWRDRPNFDPNTCSPLVRVPGAQPATWRVSLASFGARWSADANRDGVADVPNHGITILPNPRIARGAPVATWKVVFDSKHRTGGTPVTSTLHVRRLTRVRDVERPLVEPVPAAPPLAKGQRVPERSFISRPDRSIRIPISAQPSSRPLAPPAVAAVSGASGVPDNSSLRSQVPRPQPAPDAERNTVPGVPLVVVADARGFLGGHQAVLFVALLGFGVAGLLGWSLTSPAQLRGGFRWVAAMGLARRMPVVPTSKD